MACPYFDPGERLPGPSGSLGDLYDGSCRRAGRQPDQHTVADRCNLGYARGHCEHFPTHEGPDAVRFIVSKRDQAAIRILYTIERNHRPLSNGALEFSTVTGAFATAPESIERLASAYVRSYLRRVR
jgi:hypothetical protein